MPRRKSNPEQDGAEQNQATQAQTDTPEQEFNDMEQEAATTGGPSPEPAEEPTLSQAGPEIPLSVRITSLEMDGDTRAFATAEYGDLTINRLRVKEDGYGTMSVNMPKYRSPEGWRDTCRFSTTEARNRLTSAVLDAYHQKLNQIQGLEHSSEQSADDAPVPDELTGQTDEPDMDEPEQGGFGMSMSQ